MAKASGIRAGRAFVELFADDSMLVRVLKRAEARIRKFGHDVQTVGRQLAMLGLGLSVPFLTSMKVYAEFDDTMRAVKAVTQATAEEFEKLTEKAKFLGRTTSFTTNQVAEAMLQLGRAGFAPQEIDHSIKSILDLARATRTDLSESARIASASLRAFDLEASEMPRVCDVMVAAANNSAQTLEDLGFSMSYCAPIAAQYGMTIEETCKAIGALSNYGIKASQAGTTFRRILVNLADKRVQRQLKGLGIEITDKETGKMRNASAILKDLGKAMSQMSESDQISLTKDLFGVWAMAGSAKLTIAQFDRLYDAIDNAGGISARVAKEMDSGIAGSMRMLYSAVETVAITIGEALAPGLKRIADFWTRATSGMVVYLANNKKLVVDLFKTVAAISATGMSLFAVGFIWLTVAKSIAVVAAVIGTVGLVISSVCNLVLRSFQAILFVANSFVSVFTAVAVAVRTVVGVIGATVGVIFSVLTTLGSILFTVLVGTIRAVIGILMTLAGAVGIIIRAVLMMAGAVFSIVAALAPLVVSLISGLATVLVGVVSAIATGIASLFPVVLAGISAMLGTLGFAFTVIAAGISAAFASIAVVVQAAFISVGTAILSALSAGLAGIGSVLAAVFVPILTTVGGFLSLMAGMIASAVSTIVAGIASVIAGIGAAISGAITTAVTWIVVQFAWVVGLTASFIGHLIAATGAMIASVLATMAPILVVIGTIAAAAAGVYLLLNVLGAVGNMLTAVFQQAVQVVGNCLSWMMNAVIRMGGTILLGLIDCLGAVVAAIWSMAQRVGGIVAGAIGSAISSIQSALQSAWNGMVATFSAIFNALGEIVTAFGNFFLTVFDQIGTAVDWAKEKFGQLCAFAQETYGAIVASLGRGDIEAAIGVIWATIKLIWTQGATSLLKTWYWVVETLQTAWATCVFKISELLATAWYGVQKFWTESVYTMQTLWLGFSNTVVSSWKSAEKAIAHGIGWIIAKMEGLDPSQMAATIEEDYNREAQQREAEKSRKLTDVQKQRDSKMSSLKSEKEGTLGILKEYFEKGAGVRNSAYEAKIAAQEAELAKAKEAYNAAIERAKNPPPVAEGQEPETLAEKVQKKMAEVMKGFNTNLGDKVSVTGSFSAAAIASMGQTSVMDRVAKATEKSEKHLDRIAKRDEKKNEVKKDEKKPKEEQQVFEGDDPATREMKIHTRLLREIAQGKAFA